MPKVHPPAELLALQGTIAGPPNFGLSAAPDAFGGISHVFSGRALPSADQADTRMIFKRPPYRIAPHLRLAADGTRMILYYIAIRDGEGRGEWVIGPDSIETFLANIDTYAAPPGEMDYVVGLNDAVMDQQHDAILQQQLWFARWFGWDDFAASVFANVESYRAERDRQRTPQQLAAKEPSATTVLPLLNSAMLAVQGARLLSARPPSSPWRVVSGGGQGSGSPRGDLRIVSAGGGGARPPAAVRARPAPGPGSEAAASSGPRAMEGNTARKLDELIHPAAAPEPARVIAPVPAKDVAAAARTRGRTSKPSPLPLIPVVPGASPAREDDEKTKTRPPFVLRLPLEKRPHLETYRWWLGVLQSDPDYDRDHPAQRRKWHGALSPGGSHEVPDEIYYRGEMLGLDEKEIRAPNWSRTTSVLMEVDHVVELQVTPDRLRGVFDDIDNYELLDRHSNGASGRRMRDNIRAERKKQEAFDPSVKGRVLLFDAVTLDGGAEGERWGVEEIRAGEHLDARAYGYARR